MINNNQVAKDENGNPARIVESSTVTKKDKTQVTTNYGYDANVDGQDIVESQEVVNKDKTRVVTTTEEGKKVERTYNSEGKAIKEDNGDVAVEYSYDKKGNVSQKREIEDRNR